MFGSKKGLSDVVTTVLIILLAVAAVASIWLLIKPLISDAGNTVQKSSACYGNSVEFVSCTYTLNSTTEQYVSYYSFLAKVSQADKGQVKSINNVTIAILRADGSVANGFGALSIDKVGELQQLTINDNNKSKSTPKEVTATISYDLQSGGTAPCQAPKITSCTKA